MAQLHPWKNPDHGRAEETQGSGQEREEEEMEHLLCVAKSLLWSSRRREAYLPELSFRDPQWLMILDLFVASIQDRDLPVSSLCIASGAAPATAWRNIRALEALGLILREPHPKDRRSRFLRLSDSGREQVCAYLRAIGAALPRMISPGRQS